MKNHKKPVVPDAGAGENLWAHHSSISGPCFSMILPFDKVPTYWQPSKIIAQTCLVVHLIIWDIQR